MARRSASREGGLLDEPGQPFPVAQTGGLRAEGFEVIADHLAHARCDDHFLAGLNSAIGQVAVAALRVPGGQDQRVGLSALWPFDGAQGHPEQSRGMVGVSVRTVLGFLRHVAHLTGVVDGRGGAIVQRFGGAMNLNVYAHALVIDGVFARDGPDVRFCPAPMLTAADVADVLATIVPRVRRLLERRGLGDGEEGVR